VIFGCAGPALTEDERALFRASRPAGFILFARNCVDPGQLRRLVDAMRAAADAPDAPVLIDQEGGRVARLGPPHWRKPPPAAVFGAVAGRDRDAAREAVALNARLIGRELAALGITVDCTPVLDIPAPDGHDIIGDRAFGTDPALVADLGRASCDGLLAEGVIPVIKHVPGHGRARADSHKELPAVDAPLAELRRIDFAPFRALADAAWAMTAHVLYRAIDPDRCASISPRVIGEIIRREIGFDGLLVSDDLNMQALSGTLAERARAVLAAGCDLALHCSGVFDEMAAVAEAVPAISVAANVRLCRAEALRCERRRAAAAMSVAELTERLDAIIGGNRIAR
jgi:beta-N-acetylhexosaminidase